LLSVHHGAQRASQRVRPWRGVGAALIATIIAVGALATAALPTDAAAVPGAGNQLIKTWKAGYTTYTYQDTSSRVRTSGHWYRLRSASYMSGTALSARQAGSRLSLTFKGTGVAVLGPVGPTRGKARIYINGRYVRTVSAYNSRYLARQPLYKATWSSNATRTVTVEVVGTGSHPIVTVDAIVVRGAKRSASGATPPPGSAPSGPGVKVPSSINATCASDVSAKLNAWIKAQPNGSTLIFPSGSCYKLGGDNGIQLDGRSKLTLVGTGAKIQLRTTGASNRSAGFFLQNSTDITIRGFSVDGGNTATGTTKAASQVNERMSGAVVRSGSKRIEFDRVKWDRVRGFGIIIGTDGGSTWPSEI
jgi:hypothetical protein